MFEVICSPFPPVILRQLAQFANAHTESVKICSPHTTWCLFFSCCHSQTNCTLKLCSSNPANHQSQETNELDSKQNKIPFWFVPTKDVSLWDYQYCMNKCAQSQRYAVWHAVVLLPFRRWGCVEWTYCSIDGTNSPFLPILQCSSNENEKKHLNFDSLNLRNLKKNCSIKMF